MVGERYFTGLWDGAPAYQGYFADGMVGYAKRSSGEQWLIAHLASDRVYLRRL